ncbi:MAG: glycoside hydrolase family 9 protein [Firmicutes bacterium]|nr:glycoside hydrolase family 9 protein [Bacillota bacterium]
MSPKTKLKPVVLKDSVILISAALFIVVIIIIYNSQFTMAQPGKPENVIFVNQAGYLPEQQKWVVSARPASQFVVVNEDTGEIIFQGRLHSKGDYTSKKRIWRGDFTNVRKPGRYRIEIKGIGASYSFKIDKDVYNPLLELGMRSFYLQRCGIALDDPETGLRHPLCHKDDGYIMRADNFFSANARIISTGGWHDAGDYGKYVPTTAVTVAQMLTAFELWPEKFTDGQFRIPESGNGAPDILDEALIGLKWLLTMQRPDGAVYHKLSGKRWPSNFSPDYDTSYRFLFGISTASTGKFAATMAIASRVWKTLDPEFSRRFLEAALKAWEFLESHPFMWDHTDFDDEGSGAYGQIDDRVDRLWAALELATVRPEIKPAAGLKKELEQYKPTAPSWNDAAILGVFHYQRFEQADPVLRKKTEAMLVSLADSYLKNAKKSGYGYTLLFSDFAWASNKTGLARGIVLALANIVRPDPQYLNAATAQLDFVLGCNPLSKCFVTGIGSNPVAAPHHRFISHTGIVIPGLLAGGPNNNAESGVEPKGQGPFSYDDNRMAYSCNEPAIDYNAALILLTAAFAAP